MAMAVRAAQLRAHRPLVVWLILTMVLGAAFLGIKAVEYTQDYHERLIPGWNFQVPEQDRSLVEKGQVDPRRMEMFFVLYFFMTGLHAVHLIIGIALLGVMAYLVMDQVVLGRRRSSDRGDGIVLALCRRGVGVSVSAALPD